MTTLSRFKDEMGGVVIRQFCGLRAKCYSLATDDGQKQTAAGTKRCKQKLLKHHHYVETLASAAMQTITQKTIISKNHRVFTQEMNRIALNSFDVKRIVLNNGIDTVPYGYFD